MTELEETKTDDVFVERARTRFDESVDRLDGETRSRLNQARHRALSELDRGNAAWRGWVPATGVAAAAAVALVMWTGGWQADDMDESAAVTDMEILLTEDSLEMLEDLEFYSWMDLDEEAGDLQGAGNNVG